MPEAFRENPRSGVRKRVRPSDAPRVGRPWTPAEDRFLVAHIDTMSLDELAAALGRTSKGVQTHLDLVLEMQKPYVRRPRGELV